MNIYKSNIFKTVLLALVLGVLNANAFPFWNKKKVTPKKDTISTAEKEYKKVITKDAKTQKGLFMCHKIGDRYYFEIPDSVLNKEMLLVSRVSKTSDNSRVVAGQRPKEPIIVKWTKEEGSILLKEVQPFESVSPKSNLAKSLERNNFNPIIKSFKIKAFSKDSLRYVIEINDFFAGDNKKLSPFLASKDEKIFKSDNSFINKILNFPENIEIVSTLSYDKDGNASSVEMNRSLVLLPKEPMRPRLLDERVGFFTTPQQLYTENDIKEREFINRWRLEPKPEDVEKYKRGELVEPKKQIVYYIDDAFPEKWAKYLKLGIEDWQMAFEKIGFKNAIIAKPVPKDSNFHYEDVRYSVVRYATTTTANAMGPSFVDPRTGEILQGDVIWYHNVLKLLHDWRFAQTAASDTNVRKLMFNDEVTGESIRYVIAHEIGHTLGLPHNMGASYAYPVDSLRSRSFTDQMGTTPSIMDYARFNYIAQPGDGVRKFTPPLIGVYDYFAIKYGYTPIFDAKDSEDELKTLNAWIKEKENDPLYHFGEQQFAMFEPIFDPSAQTESLGDDAIKASKYGIANLKRIMPNLIKWTCQEDKDYKDLNNHYFALFNQYRTFIGHAFPYIGGIYFNKTLFGQKSKNYTFVNKSKQKEAVDFILNELKTMPDWLYNEEISKLTFPCVEKSLEMGISVNTSYTYFIKKYQSQIVDNLLNDDYLARLLEQETINPTNNYKLNEYLQDVRTNIWQKTIKKQKLNVYDRNIQKSYLEALLRSIEISDAPQGKMMLNSDNKEEEHQIGCCFHEYCKSKSLTMFSIIRNISNSDVVSYKLDEINNIKTLLEANQNTSDLDSKVHYQDLLRRIKNLDKKK